MANERQSWLDEKSGTPMIDQYAQKLGTYMDAVADGRIDAAELKAQEKRVVDLMKQIEPQLDDATHEKVTQLLCETTAYDMMQMLYSLQQARPATRFQG